MIAVPKQLIMINKWMFDKKQLRQTPSQADGVDYLTEIRYRKEGYLLILMQILDSYVFRDNRRQNVEISDLIVDKDL